MIKFMNPLMPMRLQFFAEPEDDQPDTHTDAHTDDSDNENNDKNAELIKKLQGRIGKEQSQKNELAEQLAKAQEELEALKSGKKQKKEPELTDDQLTIKKLQAQIARNDMVEKTNDVFHESGFSVPKEVVSLLVTNDGEQTITNAKTLLNFIGSVQTATEKSVRAEYKGGKLPSDTKHQDVTPSTFGKSVSESGQSLNSLDSFK